MYFGAGKIHRCFASPPQRRQKAAVAGDPGSLRMTSERRATLELPYASPLP
jgi:hypothetical protein